MQSSPATTPAPPYYAVIFTSVRKASDPEGYAQMFQAMEELAATQPGYLGRESAREYSGADNLGIAVSYWESLEAIVAWKRNAAHQVAQKRGREGWYASFSTRVCKVERDYRF